jgi:hypothetical protein
MHDEYTVGYGKPPKKNQFQKGKSGNPEGRRKPALDFQKGLISELKSVMSVAEDGKIKKITKMQALQKVVVTRALKGDKAFTKFLLDFVKDLPKNAFEDASGEEFIFRMTRKQMDQLEQFVAEAEEYNKEHHVALDQEQESISCVEDI